MLNKKICMLGASGVGKTSLVRRFVYSVFSDQYHSTIGVKIDKKVVQLAEQEVQLLLWDVQGEDAVQKVLPVYLRGMSGYLMVVDRTRQTTYEYAHDLFKRIRESSEDIPYILLQNKADKLDQWCASNDMLAEISEQAHEVLNTSALNGEFVEKAFKDIAELVAK